MHPQSNSQYTWSIVLLFLYGLALIYTYCLNNTPSLPLYSVIIYVFGVHTCIDSIYCTCTLSLLSYIFDCILCFSSCYYYYYYYFIMSIVESPSKIIHIRLEWQKKSRILNLPYVSKNNIKWQKQPFGKTLRVLWVLCLHPICQLGGGVVYDLHFSHRRASLLGSCHVAHLHLKSALNSCKETPAETKVLPFVMSCHHHV